MSKNDGLVDLKKVLRQLGQEFRSASEIDEPTIQWNGANLELETVVRRGGNGKVRFYVVEAGGEVEYQNTMRLSVELSPYDAESGGPGVGGK